MVVLSSFYRCCESKYMKFESLNASQSEGIEFMSSE